MARWRLKEKHYLNVPGTQWMQEETDRDSGKPLRKLYNVGCLLDPREPSDWNYKAEQEIIVCHEGKGKGRDIIFVGPPTYDMEPLDEEAEELSAIEARRGQHPIEGLPGIGDSYSEQLLTKLVEQIAAIQVAGAAQPIKNQSVGVDPDEFAEMKKMMAQLMEQNAALQAQLLEKSEGKSLRRA